MNKVALDSILVTILNAMGQAASFALFAVIAASFGASRETDAFFLALTVPALFTASVVNAITSVFIPIVTECKVQRPETAGRLVGSAILYVALISLSAAALVGLLTPALLQLGGGGLNEETQRLAAHHTLLLLPMITLQTVGGVLAAVYNAYGQFGLPAGTVLLRYTLTLALIPALRPITGIDSLPLSFVAGTLLQFAVLLLFWRRLSLRLQFGLRLGDDVRRSFFLALPLILGTAAIQLGVVVTRFLAAQLPPGSVSTLDYASRISSGLMELLTSGVLLVTLANWSQLAAQGDMALLRARLQQTLLMILFLIMPVVAILVALREPVTALLLQRGEFDAGTTAATAAVMLFFLLGIPADVIGRVYVRLFLVWKATWTIGALAALRMVTSAGLGFALMGALGVRGLALGDLISVVVVLTGLIALAHPRLGNTFGELLVPLLKLLIAAVVAGLGAVATATWLGGDTIWLLLPLASLVGLMLFVVTSWLLRVQELMYMCRLLSQQRKGSAL